MPQQIDAAQTTMTEPTDVAELSGIRSELNLQRDVRIDQLNRLTVDDSAAATDESRLQVNRVLRLIAESALTEIDAALGRLANGSFGTCERCFEPTPPHRQELLPTARLCTRCHCTRSGRAPRARISQSRVKP